MEVLIAASSVVSYILYFAAENRNLKRRGPFPRRRIPFLTIHQAKGLEFPVVVLGNPRKDGGRPQRVEELVHPLIEREGEPLDRMAEFDAMRMFYVGLSRAKNLLVIARYKGQGHRLSRQFENIVPGSWSCEDLMSRRYQSTRRNNKTSHRAIHTPLTICCSENSERDQPRRGCQSRAALTASLSMTRPSRNAQFLARGREPTASPYLDHA